MDSKRFLRGIPVILVPLLFIILALAGPPQAAGTGAAAAGKSGPSAGAPGGAPAAVLAPADDDDDDEKKSDDEKDSDDEKKEKEKEKDAKGIDAEIEKLVGKTRAQDDWEPTDPNEKFVKENLKEFIHGTISFARDGTTTIEYDLTKKATEFQNDFTPGISPKVPAKFRWSNWEEDRSLGSNPGIRISDDGAAFLNVWFTDDVEATMEYLNGISWSKKQVCAIVFQTKGGKGIGNNYGGQVASIQSGVWKGGDPAVAETLPFNDSAKITLKLARGTCEVLRNEKPRKSIKYPPKAFSSGRIGFVWGGKLAGTITGLKVRGKLDIPAMMKVMGGKK
jgi:hypothetical protein